MGTTTALNLIEGSDHHHVKLLVAVLFAAVAFAEPEADADAYYGHYYGHHYPTFYNSYPNWPGYSGPGFSRTVFGLRGKRSADAEPEADADADAAYFYGGYYGYPYHGYGYHGYNQVNWPSVRAPGFSSTVFGLRGKRSADANQRLMLMLPTSMADTMDI